MRILVAGGAGYVGSELVPTLVGRGYGVEVVDLCWFGCRLPDGVPVRRVDLFTLTADDLKGFDQVVFIAGLSNDPMAENDPAANFQYNGALPGYLAYQAKQAGVKRFVYASSCSIYGYLDSCLSTEDHAPNCQFPYGLSKYLGERACLQLQGPEFSVIALRKGTIGGHSARMRFDLIVNTMYRAAVTKGAITVDNPALWRPILDLRSAVSAYVRAIEAAPDLSGAFNVADENMTVGGVADEVAATVQAITGEPIGLNILQNKIHAEGRTLAALRNYKVDTSRAQQMLGWRPSYRVSDTVRRIHERQAIGDYGTDIYSEAFSNIATWKRITEGASLAA